MADNDVDGVVIDQSSMPPKCIKKKAETCTLPHFNGYAIGV